MSYGSPHQISIFFGLKKPYAPSQRKKADIMGLDIIPVIHFPRSSAGAWWHLTAFLRVVETLQSLRWN
jgi:hypothetical protein